MSSVPDDPTALASTYRFYQFINAYPVSTLATQFTHALSVANAAGSRTAADAVLSAYFQASGGFAEVTPASFGAVAEYLYRFAPAWANFSNGFTYTLAFGNSHLPNSPAVPGGTVSFTKNSNPAAAPNDGNRGYTITYTAPDGTQTPLTFSFGQLVSEVKTATPAICLQTTFMSLALFTGHSSDAQTVIPTVFGSVNGQQAIGLSQSDASSCQSGIGQFFSTYWPVIVVGAISIISVVAYYNISRAPRIPTIRERRARDYKDGLLKKKLDVIEEEEEEDDLGPGGQIPQNENPDKLEPDDLPDADAPLFRWVESIDLSEEQASYLDGIQQLIESHPMKAYMKAELEGVKTRFDEALENSKIADESGLQLSPKSGEDILNELEEIPESIEEVDETPAIPGLDMTVRRRRGMSKRKALA